MTPFVILPVKALAAGKSRLAPVLTDAERVAFNRRLAEHAIEVVIATAGPGRTIVVSRDETVLESALLRQAITLFEPHGAGLNAALDHATAEALRIGAEAVLVLPVDLPRLQAADLDAMTSAATGGSAVVIAPDRHEEGTNALLLAPPRAIPFSFGEGSLKAHVAAARYAGIEPAIVRRASLAFDVDTAEDHALLADSARGPGVG